MVALYFIGQEGRASRIADRTQYGVRSVCNGLWVLRAATLGMRRAQVREVHSAIDRAMSTAATSPAGVQRFAHFLEITTGFKEAAPDSEGDVDVPAFLAAMQKFLRVFDALASVGDFVRKDIEGNILKLGKAASKHGSATVASVVKSELSDGAYEKLIRAEKGAGCESGAVATLWMKRTMQFVHSLLRNLLSDPECSLADAARKSYGENLGLAHPWVTRRVFDTGLRFAPARNTFYNDIGGGEDFTTVEGAMKECVETMGPLLSNLVALFAQLNLETCIK
jgi:hypothetical protein